MNKKLRDALPYFKAGKTIEKTAFMKQLAKVKSCKCLYKFIAQLARKHMKNEQVSIEGIDTTDITFEKIEVLKAAQNLFIYNIVQDIKGRIRK